MMSFAEMYFVCNSLLWQITVMFKIYHIQYTLYVWLESKVLFKIIVV